MLRAHEVTTVIPITKGDYKKLVVRRYIIPAENTVQAMSFIDLDDEEEIVDAHEMVKHILIMKTMEGEQ